ncbi:MAG: InlB B-repeat-containing protein, partial [Methanomassiliicoccaceae archaeon]|nr:InlB B-repeat-containing protein [Methanomassiliicoccaceae archaeon]
DAKWDFADAIISDITLKAKYENDPEYYFKVIFDDDNGSSTEAWVLKGETVSEPSVPTKGSLTFIGWFINGFVWDFGDPVNEDMTLTAVYENDPEYHYEVTFDDDNGNAVIVWILKGEIVGEPSVPTKGSLTFVGWFLGDTEWNFSDAVTTDITLKAKYENDPEYYYKVTFDADNGLPQQEEWVLKGDTVAEPTVPSKGSLTFIGWFVNGTIWDFAGPVNEDMTLTAVYENDPEYYFKVIFDDDNGNAVIVWVLKGDIVAEPAVPAKGSLTFTGWFLNDAEWDFADAVISDITLKAKYENDPEYYFKVIFDADNGTASEEAWALKGEIVAEPTVPTKGSLTFIGWYDGDTEWEFSDAVTTDITLKAKYENDPEYYFEVTFDDDNGNTVIVWVLKGDTVAEPAIPSKGSLSFIGWFVNGTIWDFVDPVNEDMTLTAVYENDPEYYYKVIFDGDNGSLSESWVLKGEIVAEPAVPVKGSLTFIGWFLGGTEWDFSDAVTTDITLKAKYGNDPDYYFKVVFDDDSGNAVIEWVLKDTQANEPSVPSKGSLTFIGWFIGGTEWDFGDAVTADMTLTAVYENDPEYYFKVMFDDDNGSSSEVWVLKGDTVAEPATPAKGSLTFIGWFVNGTIWDFGDSVISDITLTAVYENDPEYYHKVIFDGDNGSSSEVWVLKGDTVAEPAVPVNGSLTFTGWFIGDAEWEFGTAVNGDMTLVAKYAHDPITFTVTVSVTSADGGSFEYRIDNASVYEALTGPITVVCGSYIEIRAAVNDGYSFVWDDGRASENVIAFTVTCDEDLAGTFSLLTESDSTVIWSLLILAIFALLLIFTFFAGRGEEEE